MLEPEVMDSVEDARQYDAMDHSAVNELFVTDLLAELGGSAHSRVLDLGTGTAQIPVELCRRAPGVRVTAVDAAESMLQLARENIAAAGMADRIALLHADAKQLAGESARDPTRPFDAVVSNSIIHHIPEPRDVVAAALQCVAPGGLLFHRDLNRPDDEAQLEHLVATYAADATPYQRKLFADSLRAALTVAEIRDIVADIGLSADDVQMTSDRHWTWSSRTKSKPLSVCTPSNG